MRNFTKQGNGKRAKPSRSDGRGNNARKNKDRPDLSPLDVDEADEAKSEAELPRSDTEEEVEEGDRRRTYKINGVIYTRAEDLQNCIEVKKRTCPRMYGTGEGPRNVLKH
ncbi:hypothetical protein EJ08DRAFT_682217 [Tothia fuscella]|uniref:Uncharacterized protein n=1 Tax=Tothia fuscella TaxID=1048955 RepID=A0A9P4NIX2_9PEZI|nr:hypothetical protein EJ08DRAFT_682217 [Tothia fuscella]